MINQWAMHYNEEDFPEPEKVKHNNETMQVSNDSTNQNVSFTTICQRENMQRIQT